jgi:hypothetical protein
VLRYSVNTLSIPIAMMRSAIRGAPSKAHSAVRIVRLLPAWGPLHKLQFDGSVLKASAYWQRHVASLAQMTALETVVVEADQRVEAKTKRWSRELKEAVKLWAGLEVEVRVEVKTA